MQDEDIRSLERRASAGDQEALALVARAKLRAARDLTLEEAYAALPDNAPASIVVRGERRDLVFRPVLDGCLEQIGWSSDAESKNWIATVTATPRGPSGIGRHFWERAGQRGWKVVPGGLRPGDYLEMGADDEDGRRRAYYRVLALGEEELVLRKSSKPPRKPPSVIEELERLISPDDAAERTLARARDEVARLRQALVAAETALARLETHKPEATS